MQLDTSGERTTRNTDVERIAEIYEDKRIPSRPPTTTCLRIRTHFQFVGSQGRPPDRNEKLIEKNHESDTSSPRSSIRKKTLLIEPGKKTSAR